MDDSVVLVEDVDFDYDNVNFDNEDNVVCLLCQRKEPPNDFGRVFCDSCGSWIHSDCSARKVLFKYRFLYCFLQRSHDFLENCTKQNVCNKP